MSYGWLTESTIYKKKEEIIELSKDKLSKENKNNKKNENSIDKLNSIVDSYLQNIKQNKKNEIGKKKISYHEKLYKDKNEGVDKRIEQDKKSLSIKKQINKKKKKYEELKQKGLNDINCLVNFEAKQQAECELEEIRKLKEMEKGKQK
ncbi:hypothetical protein PFAG_01375 [Plasmodium falciparum Santa Lucia]|uniref:Uncharacterized protein n=9 Tax=Plasmodium falciparum TaxID=5833 RepID=W4ISW1_PLAFP|nr:hypothetical protein PFFVO_01413 [Plasmodium falciparum Vietnam Oak-Knoll (FVO)]ETW50520.1 hypothetical protein PFMALIP_01441 [Plasmodium falciparum MaliPS096_E11]ETW53185.1 hypothetical protein PFUGPA_04813 [Plasmodium falciparum Palo Alto/Uganda]ETW62701.1 hypothetical protein PFMC_01435 [Plasmodium falciparum CAMP/Malaysia]EUR75295.1 hypothetical protein PFBG_01417 [Plasmodium falciparum 7G8]EUT89867.1 hypothetical protein PFAG_01375 [Plasmodium falciparum Santa Lucia]KNG73951.1 hypothe